MKNLLIAFLLAIFSLQAAAVAVGEMLPPAAKVEHHHAAAAADLAQQLDAVADEVEVSSPAIEALSDYLPAELSIPKYVFNAPYCPVGDAVVRSIHLPKIQPPPRG
jgi:hypothetical protein